MSTILRQAYILAAKDTKIFFKDRFAVAFSFLFPFLFVIGFSLALSGQGPDDEVLEFTLAVEDAGGGVSEETRARGVQAIQGLAAENGGGSIITVMEYADALAAVEDGELPGFVAFPANFTQNMVEGKPSTLRVIVTGETPDREAALLGFARSLAVGFSDMQITLHAIANLSGQTPSDLSESVLGATGAQNETSSESDAGGIAFVIEKVGDIEPFNASNFTLPGYLTMFVFFAAALSAEAIARERQSHTLERLMSNGVRREAIVTGKFFGTAFRGLLQILVMWIVGILAFGIDLGASPVAVVLISGLMVLSSAAFGVLLASLVREVRAASMAGVLVSLVLAPLGGCWWPLFITPQWMQSLAKITPHGWANDGFNKLLLFGAEFADVTQTMFVLAAFGVAFLAVAVWRFRLSAM